MTIERARQLIGDPTLTDEEIQSAISWMKGTIMVLLDLEYENLDADEDGFNKPL